MKPTQDDAMHQALRDLVQWLYNIRERDESLVIECAPEGVTLCDVQVLLEVGE